MRTETIFKIEGGGQAIRQACQLGKEVEIKTEKSDWPEKAKCAGQDSYTNTIWANDIETVMRWAQDWAKGNGKLKLNTVAERI